MSRCQLLTLFQLLLLLHSTYFILCAPEWTAANADPELDSGNHVVVRHLDHLMPTYDQSAPNTKADDLISGRLFSAPGVYVEKAEVDKVPRDSWFRTYFQERRKKLRPACRPICRLCEDRAGLRHGRICWQQCPPEIGEDYNKCLALYLAHNRDRLPSVRRDASVV